MQSKVFGVPLVLFFFVISLLLPIFAVETLYNTINQKRFDVIEENFLKVNNKLILMEADYNNKLDKISEQVAEPTPTVTPTKGVLKPVNN